MCRVKLGGSDAGVNPYYPACNINCNSEQSCSRATQSRPASKQFAWNLIWWFGAESKFPSSSKILTNLHHSPPPGLALVYFPDRKSGCLNSVAAKQILFNVPLSNIIHNWAKALVILIRKNLITAHLEFLFERFCAKSYIGKERN
jgi:hypothetical protein